MSFDSEEPEIFPSFIDQGTDDEQPQAFLNAADRGTGTFAGHPSYTVAQAAAQIGRPNLQWSGALGSAATVTFAFRDTAPTTMPNGTGGFSQFNSQQIAQTLLALQSWSDVANITFVRVGGTGYSNDATMLFSNYSTGAAGAAAFAYYPGSTAATATSGDTWINSTFSYNAAPVVNEYGRQVLTHEIGHAIGLAHPGDYNAGAGSPTYADATYYEDTRQYSVMSYWSESNTGGNFGGSYAAAPLLDDIAAAQRLYGANTTTRTGDTVYGFFSTADRDFYNIASSSSRAIFAIWDAGGNDTLRVDGYSNNSVIDLRQGNFSSVGGLSGNIAIAVGAVIENAYGGTGDEIIYGNNAANFLVGNGGLDTIYGFGGNDILVAGPGAAAVLLVPQTTVHNSIATALPVNSYVSLLANSNIVDSTTLPHATVRATANGTLDHYAITVNAPGRAVFDIDGASFDTIVELTDSAGTVLASNDDSPADPGSTSGLDSYLSYTFTAAGTYFVRVKAFGSTVAPAGGTYTLHFSATGAPVTATALVGSTLDGGDNDDTLVSGSASDMLIGGAGNDTASYINATSGVAVSLTLTGAQATGGSGNDTLTGIENLIGSFFADTLTGNTGNNRLSGGAGDDVLIGLGGRDVFEGGLGSDTVVLTSGASDTLAVVSLRSGSGYVGTTGLNPFTLRGIENIIGSSTNDSIEGSNGRNRIDGGAGNDFINGGLGNDILIGGSGIDTIDYQQTNGSVTVSLAITGPQNTGVAGIDTISGFENLTGGAGNDRLTGDANDNVINGFFGDDILMGGGGNDTFIGNTGIDLVSFADALAPVVAFVDATGLQVQTINGATIIMSGIEGLIGSAFADMLTGDSGNNILDGGLGADTLTGGNGNDIYFVDNSGDAVNEGPGGGIDTVRSTISYTLGADLEYLTLIGIGNINGTGNGLDNILTGNRGINVLRGLDGNDRIAPGGGNNVVDGGTGSDTLTLNGNRASYTAYVINGETYLISRLDATRGFNLETVQFADTSVSWATATATPGTFDGLRYIASNSDLIGAFGTNAASGVNHFAQFGFLEGRRVTFDPLAYLASYSDLGAVFGTDATAAVRHFIESGNSEGRSVTFDPLRYIASSTDLIAAFGANADAGSRHYITTGRTEGRSTGTFDAARYLASNTDVLAALGNDTTEALTHYIRYGYAEGRTTSTFDALRYIASYDDLIANFGTDTARATAHFLDSGFAEGRSSLLFDPILYANAYADVRAAIGFDTVRLTQHYILYGLAEGRTAGFAGNANNDDAPPAAPAAEELGATPTDAAPAIDAPPAPPPESAVPVNAFETASTDDARDWSLPDWQPQLIAIDQSSFALA